MSNRSNAAGRMPPEPSRGSPPDDERAPPRHRTGAWAAFVAAGAASPLVFLLAAGHTLVWRDTARLFEPLRAVVVVALRDLRLPLWNPFEATGMPLLAQMMHGVLHPVSVLGAFLAPGAGMDGFIVLHVVVATLGAFVLTRAMGAAPPAAAVAGFGYGLSGYVLSMSAVFPYLAAAGAAPWTVAALRAAGSGRRLGVPAAAIAVAIQVFAGDPQWTILAVVLGGALALAAGRASGTLRAVLGVALGAMIAGVQLVPAWAFLGDTDRALGLSAADRAQWALPPWRVLELALPGLVAGRPGASSAPLYRAIAGPGAYGIPFVASVSLGAVLLLLAAAGARANRETKVLAVAAVVGLWLALGTHLGADQMLRNVPIWGAFRYAEKLTGPVSLCCAVLAGIGADRVRPSRRAAAGVAIAATVMGAAALLLFAGADAALTSGTLSAGRERAGIALVHTSVALLLLGASLAASSRARAASRFPALAAAVVLVSSAAAASFALHAGTPGVRDPYPLRALRADAADHARVAVAVRGTEETGPAQLDDSDRVAAVDSRMGQAPYAAPSGIDALEPYTGLVPRPFAELGRTLGSHLGPSQWLAWRRYGLTHVALGTIVNPADLPDAEAATVGGRRLLEVPEFGFTLWEVPHRPWASFAERAVRAGSAEDAMTLVSELERAGDPAVVVEQEPPPLLSPGRVLSATRGTERVRIEAEAAGPALLVVNDAFWPGWEATIDGAAVAIGRADGLVRAVRFPPGRHVLEMRYAPWEVRAGLLLSALGLVALLVLFARALRMGFGRT